MSDSQEKPIIGPIPGSQATLAFGRETREWQEFYSALGYCINQWSHIDRSLFDCCALCLATTETKAAIVYYSFASFEFRKKLVSELLEVSLPLDLKKQWDSALAEMSRLVPLRNVIAHQPIRQQGEIVWDMWAEGGPKVHRAGVRLEVNVEEKELLRGKRKPQTILIEDLRQHTKDVAELSKAMDAIAKSFRRFVEGTAQSVQPDSTSSLAPKTSHHSEDQAPPGPEGPHT